jgi:hypothetical protein
MAAETLTAILAMPRGFAELAEAVRHLQAQTRQEAIEVVLVHTPAHAAEIDRAAFARFKRLTTVAVDRMPTVASAFVAAVERATGDVIALVEDHVMVDPGWAEAVLAAHTGPSAAVAPRMSNGNPATAVSWANFLASFSEAVVPRAAGPVESGPGHNTSYKRSVLQQYWHELSSLYQSERTFHYRLRADGHVIVHEPTARVAHLNISVPGEAFNHALLGGAMFGAYRSRGMSVEERVARTLLAPLVPPLRLLRMLGLLRGAAIGVPASAWVMLPVLLAAHAAGEAIGYWGVIGGIESRYEHFELHRLECLRPDERALMTGA